MMKNRHHARVLALQMLYQWEIGRTGMDDVLQTFWESRTEAVPERVRTFASNLFRGTVEHVAELDRLIREHTEHWRLERLATVDRLILRLAVYESMHVPETPQAVVIDEAIELAKEFCADDSAGFINGVLDGVKRSLEAARAQPQR